MPVNASERFCLDVCTRSFLSLWSFGNPQAERPGAELCDILVVCEPDVIVFSVKDCTLTQSGDPVTDLDRWLRRAVLDSVRQVYGAERRLRRMQHVVTLSGQPGLPLPPKDEMRVHRVAVALGSEGKVPLVFGDFDKGFVHVFDERSFAILLWELDTVPDFLRYLAAKEAFYRSGRTALMAAEEDLLAVYLHGGRAFPEQDVVVLDPGAWSEFVDRPEYRARKEEDRLSYAWDGLIEVVAEDVAANNLEFGTCLAENERVLRAMAREDRFARRLLGKAYREFLDKSVANPLARLCSSPSGVVYVFLALPRSTDRRERQAELQGRCWVAKSMYPEAELVVGIGTEQYSPEGFSLDVALFMPGEWTQEHEQAARRMQVELGYFRSPIVTHRSEDEWPAT